MMVAWLGVVGKDGEKRERTVAVGVTDARGMGFAGAGARRGGAHRREVMIVMEMKLLHKNEKKWVVRLEKDE